jgi:exonuclease III
METLKFYNKVQEVIDKTNNNKYLIIAGDFNAQVGTQSTDQNVSS